MAARVVDEAEWDSPAAIAALRAYLSGGEGGSGEAPPFTPISPPPDEAPIQPPASGDVPPAMLSDDACLARFLRARRGDVHAAGRALCRHLQWRREHCPHWPAHTTPAADIRDALLSGSGFVHGTDTRGRPIVYVCVGRHDGNMARDKFYPYVSFVLDETIARCTATGDASTFVGILDADGLSWSSFDRDAIKYILSTLHSNFVERLGTLYIVNNGRMFQMLWAIVQPFLDARTAAKIHFLGGPDAYKPRLREELGAGVLRAYGGDDAYEYSGEHVLATPSSYITVREGLNKGEGWK